MRQSWTFLEYHTSLTKDLELSWPWLSFLWRLLILYLKPRDFLFELQTHNSNHIRDSPLACFTDTSDSKYPPQFIVCACACSVTKSCLTLCDPMDCSLPGFSVHGISQARILEWLSFPSPEPGGDLSEPGIQPTSPALVGRFFTTEPLGKPNLLHYSPNVLLLLLQKFPFW